MVTTPTRKSYLDNLTNSGAILPDSKNWLIGALDPFHDFEYSPKGLPDTFGGNSVIQFLKKQINVSAPPGIADDELWDCHVLTMPFLDTRQFTNGVASFRKYSQLDADPVSLELGTVSVLRGSSGTPLLPNASDWDPTDIASNGYSPTDGNNSFSMMRLIGGGFEATNTTAELYKNGSVCVYSQPQETSDTWITDETDDSFGMCKLARLPSPTLSEANSNVNSVTWAAEEGCYVPFRLDLADTAFQLAKSTPLLLRQTDDSSGGSYPCLLQNKSQIPTGSVNPFFCNDGIRFCGLETSGAYFTGLAKQTTLTLTLRFIMEIAPTPANQTLISIAKPSAEYDPMAMVLYTRAIRELPPGTMVRNNEDGDWWKVISSAVRTVAPVIGAMGPTGALVSRIATGVVGAVSVGKKLAEHVRTDPGIKQLRADIAEANKLKRAKAAENKAAKPKAKTAPKGKVKQA